ncbi:MAG: UDP-N-acetylmuramate dehydrogenase [Abditibacteriota bacterium]|nr:UDP-N-acetylmuramate dehydrogenase [Abditibacteriota bacterium]
MNIIEDLNIDGVEILQKEPLSKRTTFGIGGCAKVFLNISTIDALKKGVIYLNQNSIPYMVIGDGTNLLVTDKDLDIIFIKLVGDFKEISYFPNHNSQIVTSPLYSMEGEDSRQPESPTTHTEEDNFAIIRVGAGVKLSDLTKDTLKKGFGGLEKIGSIPGTIGGACLMNAGVRYFDISTYIESVGVIDKKGNAFEMPKESCQYSYRESIFQQTDEYIITHANLRLVKTDTTPLWDVLIAGIEKRKATQPKGKCAGCFFKNQNNQSSGKLIEECGLKGLSVGDAYVAQEHANFIMNRGNATAIDVLRLANIIKEEVRKQKGANLQFEVRIIKNE